MVVPSLVPSPNEAIRISWIFLEKLEFPNLSSNLGRGIIISSMADRKKKKLRKIDSKGPLFDLT